MDPDTQRTVALWTVVFSSFLLLAGFLYTQDALTAEVVVFYWFPLGLVTLLGGSDPALGATRRMTGATRYGVTSQTERQRGR